MLEQCRPGPDIERVVQIATRRGGRLDKVGSGYHIAQDLILTCAHVVDGAESVSLRFVAGPNADRDVPAFVLWSAPEADVAVLRPRHEQPEQRERDGARSLLPTVQPVRFGRISGTAAVPCEAVGCPSFKRRDDPRGAAVGRPVVYRDTVHAVGVVRPLSNAWSGRWEFTVEGPLPDARPGGADPVWGGMSGAPLWSCSRIVGMITMNHPDEGPGRLTATRVEGWHLSDEQFAVLHRAAGMPSPERLDLVGREPVPVSSALRRLVRDASATIDYATRDFVGRGFISTRIERFAGEEESGYFLIVGEPGIGKTAVMAQLVKARGHVHHFVQRDSGPQAALKNLSAQLILRYGLDYGGRVPDDEAFADWGFTGGLVHQVSRSLGPDERVFILLDALDEAAHARPADRSVFDLPRDLPRGIFVVATTRPQDTDARVQLDARVKQPFLLKADLPENEQDVREYVALFASRAPMRDRIAQLGLTEEDFADLVWVRSEGSFIYLRHVLPAVVRGSYRVGGPDAIPQGLKNYYEDLWGRMYRLGEGGWADVRGRVLAELAASPARIPMTQQDLRIRLRLDHEAVNGALSAWREFLEVDTTGPVRTYRIYHDLFQKFLHDQPPVREARAELGTALLDDFRSEYSELPTRYPQGEL